MDLHISDERQSSWLSLCVHKGKSETKRNSEKLNSKAGLSKACFLVNTFCYFIVSLCRRNREIKPKCILSIRNTDDDGRVTVTNDRYFLQMASVVQLELLSLRNSEHSSSSSVCVGCIVILLLKFLKLKQQWIQEKKMTTCPVLVQPSSKMTAMT